MKTPLAAIRAMHFDNSQQPNMPSGNKPNMSQINTLHQRIRYPVLLSDRLQDQIKEPTLDEINTRNSTILNLEAGHDGMHERK
jgi:hypothetical protein